MTAPSCARRAVSIISALTTRPNRPRRSKTKTVVPVVPWSIAITGVGFVAIRSSSPRARDTRVPVLFSWIGFLGVLRRCGQRVVDLAPPLRASGLEGAGEQEMRVVSVAP